MFLGFGQKYVNILILLLKELKLQFIRFGGYKSTQTGFPGCSWEIMHAEFLSSIHTKNSSHKLFWLKAYNSHNNPYRPVDISKFGELPATHISNDLLHSLSNFCQLRKFWCWTHVSNKDWKYLLLSLRVYARSQVSVFQTAAINYWSDLGKKTSFSSQNRFQHLPEPLSERETK